MKIVLTQSSLWNNSIDFGAYIGKVLRARSLIFGLSLQYTPTVWKQTVKTLENLRIFSWVYAKVPQFYALAHYKFAEYVHIYASVLIVAVLLQSYGGQLFRLLDTHGLYVCKPWWDVAIGGIQSGSTPSVNIATVWYYALNGFQNIICILTNVKCSGPEVIKLFMLNSTEHKILTAH